MTAGLCDTCRYQRVMVSDRGSRFSRCELSLERPEFPKYPHLPVFQCEGYSTNNAEVDSKHADP